MTIKVGINGCGRIGRLFLRAAWQWPEFDFIQLNDPAGDAHTTAHLLKFDSVHGTWSADINGHENTISINGHSLAYSRNTTTEATDWSGCHLVIEASGKLKTKALLQAYLDQGVQRVLVTAPIKQDGVLDLVVGVNHHLYDPQQHQLVTAASCTTNCLAPIVKVLDQNFGMEWGLMTTIHSYTGDQRILDNSHRDLRRARAAALNMVPTTTGAAKAVALVYPEVKGKLTGFAMRVPTPNVSAVDLTFGTTKGPSVEDVKAVMKEASENGMKGIIKYSDLPLVSTDFAGTNESTIFDADLTYAMGTKAVKILAWYDNEWGYSQRVVDLAEVVAKGWK